MADGADRREARRFTMSLPMRVLPGKAHKSELLTHTRDVSYRGLYFLCETKFEIGTPIDFVITLPQQVTQANEVNIRCHGQILRVEQGANGNMGVAAKIEQYEFVHAAPSSL